jgi:hypothetical protein
MCKKIEICSNSVRQYFPCPWYHLSHKPYLAAMMICHTIESAESVLKECFVVLLSTSCGTHQNLIRVFDILWGKVHKKHFFSVA